MTIQSSLLDFLHEIGINKKDVKFQNKQKIAYILCPNHSEKTPSMRITPGINFYCFGCGSSGSGKKDFFQVSGPPPYYFDTLIFDNHTSDEIEDIPFWPVFIKQVFFIII